MSYGVIDQELLVMRVNVGPTLWGIRLRHVNIDNNMVCEETIRKSLNLKEKMGQGINLIL